MGIDKRQILDAIDTDQDRLRDIVANIRRNAFLLLSYRNDPTAQEEVDKLHNWAQQLPVLQARLSAMVL